MASDVNYVCRGCGAPCVFRASNQAYFRRRGWAPPKRCEPCLAARRRAHGQAPPSQWLTAPRDGSK